jgi:putative transposase
MKVMKAFKYRLKTDYDDEAVLSRFSGCTRFVWNHALSFQKEFLDSGNLWLTYDSLTSMLPVWKKEYTFLKDVYSQILQQGTRGRAGPAGLWIERGSNAVGSRNHP